MDESIRRSGSERGRGRKAISVKPRANCVTGYINRVLTYINGNMCRAVRLADRLRYYFGRYPVNDEYFGVTTAYLAESDPLSLYPKSRQMMVKK